MTEVQQHSKPRTWFRPTTLSAGSDISIQLPAAQALLTVQVNPAIRRKRPLGSSVTFRQPVSQLRLASQGMDCCSAPGVALTAASSTQHPTTAGSLHRQKVTTSTACVAARSWRRGVTAAGSSHCASSLESTATFSETGLQAAHGVRSSSSVLPHASSLIRLTSPPDKPGEAVAQSRRMSLAPVGTNEHGPAFPAPVQRKAWTSTASAASARLPRSKATWQRPEQSAARVQVPDLSRDTATTVNSGAASLLSIPMQQSTALNSSLRLLHPQHQANFPASRRTHPAIFDTTVTAIHQHGTSATAESMGVAKSSKITVRKRMTYIRRRTISLDGSSSRPPSLPRAVPVHLRAASLAQQPAAAPPHGSIGARHASSWRRRSRNEVGGAVVSACDSRAGRGCAGGTVGTTSSLQARKLTPSSNNSGRLHTWTRQTSPATTARANARARQVLRQLRTPRPHTWHSTQLQASQQQHAQLKQPPTTRLPVVGPRQHMYVAARSRNSVLVRLSGGLAAGRVGKRSKKQPFLHTFQRTVQEQPGADGRTKCTASTAPPSAGTAAKACATATSAMMSSAHRRKCLVTGKARHRYVSQALQRSLANTRARAAAAKAAKARGHCLSYCRFGDGGCGGGVSTTNTDTHLLSALPAIDGRTGVCSEVLTGSCPHVHDASKRAVCTAWLQGSCTAVTCPLQHERRAELMPVCSFFLKGICSNADCPYLHVNYPPDAPICRYFLAGHCPMGSACPKKHYSYSMAKQVGALKRKAKAQDDKGGTGKEARLT